MASYHESDSDSELVFEDAVEDIVLTDTNKHTGSPTTGYNKEPGLPSNTESGGEPGPPSDSNVRERLTTETDDTSNTEAAAQCANSLSERLSNLVLETSKDSTDEKPLDGTASSEKHEDKDVPDKKPEDCRKLDEKREDSENSDMKLIVPQDDSQKDNNVDSNAEGTESFSDSESEFDEETMDELLKEATGEEKGETESQKEKEEASDSGEEEEDDTIKIDEEALKERDSTLTEEEKGELKDRAQEYKTEGNRLFKEGNYVASVTEYTTALQTCPLCYAKERSIMYSNRGAAKLHLEKYEAAIDDCTKAVELNPNYLKALLRRAELYERTEKLDEALTDYTKVLEMDPSQHSAREAAMRLPDQIKERNEKMKEEMMGKLKDLGNMILKPFGLSTNNFQLQQDPNTGGYSVSFAQNPQQ